MEYIIGNIRKGGIAYSFDAKFPNMRKAEDFVIYPVEFGQDYIAIQSDKRYALVYENGNVVMSASHASYANYWKLTSDILNKKEKRFTLEADDLAKLQPFMRKRNEILSNGVMQVQY